MRSLQLEAKKSKTESNEAETSEAESNEAETSGTHLSVTFFFVPHPKDNNKLFVVMRHKV